MSKRVTQKQAARVVREQLAGEQRRRRQLVAGIVAAVTLVVAGLIGVVVYAAQDDSSEFTAPPSLVQENTGVPVGTGSVTVDVYLDFLCPICKQFEDQYGATLEQLVSEGKATVVYHPIAILDHQSTTDYSTRAAASAGCAIEQDKYMEYAKALFANQPEEGGAGLTDDKLIELAAGAGLDQSSFSQCVKDGKYKSWPAHTTDYASGQGVTGTPTIMVNNKKVNPDAIVNAVNEAS